jgi:hypothetical protein
MAASVGNSDPWFMLRTASTSDAGSVINGDATIATRVLA